MKSLTKAIAIASLASVSAAATAVEGLSTTIGMVSDYNFRGVNLGDAGANVSVDYTNSGFTVGVWAINDGNSGDENASTFNEDGSEYDVYLSYAGEVEDFSYGIGYTRYEYTYTSDFEHEINLSGAIAGFGLDVAIGTAETEDGSDDSQDYTVIDLSYANGPYGILLGMVDADDADNTPGSEAEWKRIEFSYSATLGDADLSATYGRAFDAEEGGGAAKYSSVSNDYLVLSISKSFDL